MNTTDFERGLAEHQTALRGLARRLIGNRDEAEDVLQESLLKATKSVASFREESSLKTWLFSIVTRTAIDHLRATKRWRTQAMIEACDERGRAAVGHQFSDPTVSFDVRQHIAFCFTCVGRSLEPKHQAALVLREVLGIENAEAAQMLELTEPAFRHALAEARADMTAEYEGLCALVNKNGACHQCTTLRDLAPDEKKGPPLPAMPFEYERRLDLVRGTAGPEHRLNDAFFEYVRHLQTAAPK